MALVENGGLVGLAFHPRFREDVNKRFVFAFYTAPIGVATSRLSRFSWPEGAPAIDAASEEVLISVAHDQPLHLNDDLHFGPDGYLYASMGDGGPHGDPLGRAQNPFDLRGKIWRIDVDGSNPYGIPPGNPFENGGGAPEVYALGLRNPFRFSFDSHTRALYAGDVGFDTREEIDRIEAGGNYGWNCFEGTAATPPSWNASCSGEVVTPPIHEYGPSGGSRTMVTGGRVYRGSEIPELIGKYLFADFMMTNVWALDVHDGSSSDLGPTGVSVIDFSEGQDGEIYVTDFGSGTFRKLGRATGDEPPSLLSETGCFDPQTPSEPLPALIPFEVRAELWADGARKRRWMALPDGATIQIEAEGPRKGDFDFPPGTVLIKELSLPDGPRLETRFFVRHLNGNYSAYSYEWKQDQSDATLIPNLPGARLVEWGEQSWEYPTRGQCFACHTSAAGWSLGPETFQFDLAIRYPATGRRANQLITLARIGVLDPEVLADADAPEIYPLASSELYARAMLHANCAHCHRPGGPGGGPGDFRYSTALVEMDVCNVLPATSTFDIESARLLAPGSAERSMVYARMARRGTGQMPPLATRTPDEDGLAALRQWIDGLEKCCD